MASGKRPLNLRFGGWGSYQEWVEHGFTPKSTHERAAKPDPGPPAAPPVEPVPKPSAKQAVDRKPSAKQAVDRARAAAAANGAPTALSAGERRPAAALPPPKARPERPRQGPPVPPPPQPVDLYPAPPQGKRPNEPLIRPYILTGGRTRPRHDLDLHALVHTTEEGRTTTRTLPAEHQSIRRLCNSAHSVAEIAALVNVPLGVARILIDDMEEQGLISVTMPPREDEHSVELLTRVLEGLRAL
jgi:Protein of unknown function (DUF742)